MPADPGGPEIAAAASLAPTIASRAGEIERARRLPDDITQEFADTGLIQMAVAKRYGGLESHPLDIVETIELISQADASAGWCLMNYQTAALVSGVLTERWATEIFAGDERAIPSGVLAPTGKGRRVDDGIVVSGQWSFGSGCPGANWFFGMVIIAPDPVAASDTQPELVLAALSRDQFSTSDNWNVSGLCGTGSGDVIVDEQFVPNGRWYVPGAVPEIDTPLYRIPLSTTFPPTVAAVAIGTAAAALDTFENMLRGDAGKTGLSPLANHPTVQSDFARAEALIAAARHYVRTTTDAMWQAACNDEPVTENLRREARLAAAHATESSARAVDLLFSAAGSTSILLEQPLQRYWRDVHAITKHIQVSRKNFETMGGLRLTGSLTGQL